MNPSELEAVYDALAAALERSGRAGEAALLARLVLLLAAEYVEHSAFLRALAAAEAAASPMAEQSGAGD